MHRIKPKQVEIVSAYNRLVTVEANQGDKLGILMGIGNH